MEIAITSFEHWQIVALSGRFVSKAIDQVKKVFDTFEKADYVHVALDLSQTTHLDSRAISCILQFYKRISVKNGKIVLFGANNDIWSIINIVGLCSTFPFFKNKDDFEQNIGISAKHSSTQH